MKRKGGVGLLWIGMYDIVKGTSVLILGLVILHLRNRDLQALVESWVRLLHADANNRLIHLFLAQSGLVTARELALVSAGSFFYAGLHYAEGIGLMLRKRWAEYLTIVVTGAFLPVEFYEIFEHLSVIKMLVAGINIACVVYVARQIYAPPALPNHISR